MGRGSQGTAAIGTGNGWNSWLPGHRPVKFGLSACDRPLQEGVQSDLSAVLTRFDASRSAQTEDSGDA